RIEAVVDARRGAVRGVALQDGGVTPLAGAEVFLSGTGYAATAAQDGTFLLESVRPGEYDLVVVHPVLDSLGEAPRRAVVEVVADSVAVAEVRAPDREASLLARCADRPLLELTEPDFREEGDASVAGGVVLDASGRPVAGWPVRVRWIRPSLEGGTLVREDWRGTVLFTDSHGGWAACGPPADVSITVESARESLSREAAAAGQGRWDTPERVGILGAGATAWVTLRGGER
ncbi:MAG TPA: hypothetical protein VLA43_00555, partial [Longimicrobiales bacterium]|nr:hypothetical protein [Longimicrobiales bacterium]